MAIDSIGGNVEELEIPRTRYDLTERDRLENVGAESQRI
jgi:hypothetical protein